MFDDFDDLCGNTLTEGFGLMRRTFELTVELTGGHEDGQFANSSAQARSVS